MFSYVLHEESKDCFYYICIKRNAIIVVCTFFFFFLTKYICSNAISLMLRIFFLFFFFFFLLIDLFIKYCRISRKFFTVFLTLPKLVLPLLHIELHK